MKELARGDGEIAKSAADAKYRWRERLYKWIAWKSWSTHRMQGRGNEDGFADLERVLTCDNANGHRRQLASQYVVR
ncbi:hypothetical protein VNO80_19478 [Phaseolus coccineus]|uniref:Uncharacterized protein n=1 Tax=Phaseolus coccineus TaxID=3886 RepID=A0AAN9MLA0_PHACN